MKLFNRKDATCIIPNVGLLGLRKKCSIYIVLITNVGQLSNVRAKKAQKLPSFATVLELANGKILSKYHAATLLNVIKEHITTIGGHLVQIFHF